MSTKSGRIVINVEGTLTHVTRPFGHVILRDHVINYNYYIFTYMMPMATKFDRQGGVLLTMRESHP